MAAREVAEAVIFPPFFSNAAQMRIQPTVALLFITISTGAVAQSSGEFAALACKPTVGSAEELNVKKQGKTWALSYEGTRILLSSLPISDAKRADGAGTIVYFRVDTRHPQASGWVLHRLSDGTAVQIIEAQTPPHASCVASDGSRLAYVTPESQAVQIDLAPAYARLQVWAGDVADDRTFVPRK